MTPLKFPDGSCKRAVAAGLAWALVLSAVAPWPASAASPKRAPAPASAAAPTPKAPDTEVCLACHGDATRPGQPGVPGITGQPKLFTQYQLFFFREGRRKNPEMNALAKEMSDADLVALSEAIEKLPPRTPSSDGVEEARYQRGGQLAAQHICHTCHKPDYSGREQMPRLAGQLEAYMVKAMQDYKAGVRVGTQAAMAEALAHVDDAGVADLAHYLNHLRP
jgi:cytochrome c553